MQAQRNDTGVKRGCGGNPHVDIARWIRFRVPMIEVPITTMNSNCRPVHTDGDPPPAILPFTIGVISKLIVVRSVLRRRAKTVLHVHLRDAKPSAGTFRKLLKVPDRSRKRSHGPNRMLKSRVGVSLC